MDAVCIPPNCRQSTLYDRVSKLLESFEWSDCSFLVGSEVIRAHKLILAISSPVFKVMLYGPMAEAAQIIISDIEPDVFQLLLDFVYKDKVIINSLENACGLLYASKKYMLPYLTEICLKYIEDWTSIRNVLSVFNFAEWIQEENLSAYCLSLICKHAEIILFGDFEHISVSCLKQILQKTSINIREIDLIRVALQWSHEECLARDLIPSSENKRLVLVETGVLSSLRFLTILPDEVGSLRDMNILTDSEMMIVNNYFAKKIDEGTNGETHSQISESTKSISEISVKSITGSALKLSSLNTTSLPRNSVKLVWSYCCRPVLRTANPLIVDQVSQGIKVRIKCQKTVFVNSFSIPTRQSPELTHTNESPTSYVEHINIIVFNSTNISDQITTEYNSPVDYNGTIYIDLPKPFIFNEDEWYTVSFSWPGNKCQPHKYPLCYRPTITYNSEAIFTFDDNFENILPCGSFVEGLKFCI